MSWIILATIYGICWLALNESLKKSDVDRYQEIQNIKFWSFIFLIPITLFMIVSKVYRSLLNL